jgi:hypothetical protein
MAVTFESEITNWPTLQAVTADTSAVLPVLNRDSAWTIAVVLRTTNGPWVSLPSGCQVGDLFEIYMAEGSISPYNVVIQAPSSESFSNGGVTGTGPGLMRKVSTSTWGIIQG